MKTRTNCEKQKQGVTTFKLKTLTIVTAPVDVDAAAIVAGKLSEGKTGGVGC